MTYRLQEFDQESKYISAFLSLPRKLYSREKLTQNLATEKQLLMNTHVLSPNFVWRKFLVYQQQEVVGRIGLTLYSGDPTAYLGFFEAIDVPEVARKLFQAASQAAKESGCERILGPVDCSFWLRYRLKIDDFDLSPYFGEPYNLPYYLKFFQNNGFVIKKRYVSHYYCRPPLIFGQRVHKYSRRLERFRANGYQIKSVQKKHWDDFLLELYPVLTQLYQSFPAYKPISCRQFIGLFDYLQYIVDFSFLKVAYWQGQLVGFYLTFPNYENLFARQQLLLSEKILLPLKKIRTQSYVILYAGVLPIAAGLAKALARTTISSLYWHRGSSIGALIQAGKVTEKYLTKYVTHKSHYVLLEKAC